MGDKGNWRHFCLLCCQRHVKTNQWVTANIVFPSYSLYAIMKHFYPEMFIYDFFLKIYMKNILEIKSSFVVTLQNRIYEMSKKQFDLIQTDMPRGLWYIKWIIIANMKMHQFKINNWLITVNTMSLSHAWQDRHQHHRAGMSQ